MGFRVVSLGDVIQLEDSKRQPLSSRERDNRRGVYPYYGAQGIVDYLDDYTYEGDYLLVAEDGENLRSRKQPIANAAHGRFRVNNHAHVIAATKCCNLIYLRHLLNNMDIAAYVTGSTQPKLSQTSLLNMKVELPEIDKQDAIATFLHCFDAKITANAKLNGYLEELCDALFLDFLEQADGSWHEGTLEELAEVKYGKDHKKLADGPYPVYGSGGFMRSAEKSLFSGESVLIPRKGSLNNVMYVNEAFWTVDTMFFTVPRIPGAAKFLYQYVKRLDLASMNSGSAVPSMTTSILNALSLPVPPRDSLLSFNAKLQSMYDAVRANNLENRRLESLRDSLLPKLMTGEIDVSKIDLTQLNSHLA